MEGLKILPFSLSGNSYQLKLNSLEFGDYEYLVTVEGQNISKKGIFKVNKFKVEEQFTKANSGKAFYSSLQGLGEFIFKDYKDSKKKRRCRRPCRLRCA